MKRQWLAAVLLLTLAACQTTGEYPITSPFYVIPAGSRLELLKPLDIAPGYATVRLQFGNTVSRFASNDFEPLCVFESRVVGEAAQRIAPDSFTITRVRLTQNEYAAQAEPGDPRAHLVRLSFHSGGGLPRQYYKTELFLHSDKQPQILVMTCQHAWEPYVGSWQDLRPLTVAEMRQAMGDYFALHLPGAQ